MIAFRVAFVVSLILPALLLTSSPAVAFCEILEPPSPLPTQVNGTRVEIQLTEGFARVVIIKEFYNPSDLFKEGQVFFPLEKGHELITDLSLTIGNVVYNSSAGDRGEALDDFLEAVAQGQDAALVQYDPPRDVYWIAVTIPPRETRTTITTLEMPLTKRDGYYEYHYRLSVDARDSRDYLRVHVRIETAAPLEHVHLPSHPDVPIFREGDRTAEAYVNDTAAAQGRDLHIHFGSAGASLAQFVEGTGERFVRYAVDVADPAFAASLAPSPRALLVALDASGSMGLDDRWTVAKDTVHRIADGLGPGETFGLVVFGGRSITVFSPGLHEASPDLALELARFLDGRSPRGSTSLTAAFPWIGAWARTAGDRGQQPVLVLVSDGRPTRGSLDLDLERAFSLISFDRRMPVFALAVRPSDHAAENLLRNLSHFQGGDLFSIYGADARDAVISLLSSIRVPVLRGIRSYIPAAPDAEFANANPQTLLQGGEAVVLANLRGWSDDSLGVRLAWGDVDGGETIERTFAGTEIPEQPLLRRQWLLMRIHGMLSALRAYEDPDLLASLRTLATENRVVTPYTSLLVVIPTPQVGGAESDRQTVGDGALFGGVAGGPASPSSFGGRPLGIVSPLEAEARRAEAMRRDLANPLVVDRELDRIVFVGTPEYGRLDQRTAISRFEGTFLRVLEVGDELVGVVRDDFAPLRLVPNGIGLAIATLSLSAVVLVRRRRR